MPYKRLIIDPESDFKILPMLISNNEVLYLISVTGLHRKWSNSNKNRTRRHEHVQSPNHTLNTWKNKRNSFELRNNYKIAMWGLYPNT